MAGLRTVGVDVPKFPRSPELYNSLAWSIDHGALSFLPAEMTGELKGQSAISFIAGDDLSLSWEAEVEGAGHNQGLG